MKSLFEEMGGTYRQVGDYLIPNLVLPDDGNYQIGKYGRMRRIYLKEHRKILYTNYVMEGTLFKHSHARGRLQIGHAQYVNTD